MTNTTIIVEATLQPDGVTLQLDSKVALPAGRVRVTVQSTVSRAGPTMLEALDRVHRDQQQRGRPPMAEGQMAAGIAQMRADDDEYEKRWREIWSQGNSIIERTDNL